MNCAIRLNYIAINAEYCRNHNTLQMEATLTLNEVFTDNKIRLKFNDQSMDGLFTSIAASLKLINRQLEQIEEKEEIYSTSSMANIVSGLLIKLNLSMTDIDDYDHKENCDRVINELISSILYRIAPSSHQLFLTILRRFLFDSCAVFDVDFNEITKGIDLKYFYSAPLSDRTTIPKYVWSGSTESFDSLVDLIHNDGICAGDEFRKLFDDTTQNKFCMMNRSRPDEFLQFMVCLKESGLIKTSGIRGFYKVLETRVFDFNNAFLKNKPAQRRVDVVKNLVSWEANQWKYNEALKTVLLICH